jgi:hypothetical protein
MAERTRIYRDHDGVRRTLIWDDEDPDKVVVHTEQDLEEILAGAARRRDDHKPHADMQGVGYVPVSVWERACLEQWDEGDWRKWWRGDGKPFRTSPGEV